MLSPTEIATTIGSLKAAFEIVKSFIGVRDATVIQSKIFELQREILSAQQSALSAQQAQFSLLEQIDDLEKQIADMKTWETEKQNYQLTEVAPRVFAYALKPGMGGTEPLHWICAVCYQNGKKSILQGFNSGQSGWTHSCPVCHTEISTGF
jgi:rubrerythrin